MELEDSARERSARSKSVVAIAIGAALTATAGLLASELDFRTASVLHFGGPSSDIPSGGYFLRFPEHAESPSLEADNGGARLVIGTNLPNGTKLYVTQEEHPGTNGVSCCPPIERGQFVVEEAFNSSCLAPQGAPRSTGFTISIEVRHSYEDLRLWDFGVGMEEVRDNPEPRQPRHVLEVLGENFELLTGPQVVSEDGVNKLVASRTYDWPRNTCAPVLDQLVPQDCDYEAQLQADAPEEAMMWFIGAIWQARLCEIYAEQITPDLRQAEPWEAFNKRWDRWMESLGSLANPDSPRDSPLSWRFTDEKEKRYAVEILLRGRMVLRAELLSLPYPPGSSPSTVPYWGFSHIELF